MRVWKKSEVGGVVVERALWIVELKLCGWEFRRADVVPASGPTSAPSRFGGRAGCVCAESVVPDKLQSYIYAST